MPVKCDKLKQARDFEATYVPFISEEARPCFHLTPTIGWMNDPNGFSLYKGEYHLFYQYYPYDRIAGPMHWGHAKTRDFIRWERLPAALAPDQEYDKSGCWSGSAVELPDGRHLLMYTGNKSYRREDGKVRQHQVQCLAFGDGVDYVKYEGNPVLSDGDVPENGSTMDFRDPKIWREGDSFYAVVGNRTPDGSGTILMYESPDALHWRFIGKLASCHNQYGRMWECPDFFNLDGKDVLFVSPQEMKPIGLEFHLGNGTVCLIGRYDRENVHLIREKVQAIDYGIDFYAPQTVLTEDGRRVMIGWMQNWETSQSKPEEGQFFGAMTVPRELRVVDGRLIQNPVRELERYRGTRVSYSDVVVSDELNLSGIEGRVLDMTLTIRPWKAEAMYRYFWIKVASNGEDYTSIRFKPGTDTVRVDRTHSGFPHDILNVRDFQVHPDGGNLKLRIVMDRNSMELFLNDGEQAASFILYTPQEASSISFRAEGMAVIDVEKYDLVFEIRKTECFPGRRAPEGSTPTIV